MKHKYYLILIIAIVVAGICFFYCPFIIHAPTSPTDITLPANTIPMNISSSAFSHKGSIPSLYTCDGKNINPPLTFSDIPTDAKSLVLILDDPDAPAGIWDHWIMFNIPPATTRIEEGKIPEGVLGKNSSGKTAYGGPCPPDREHRYFFKLYALDTMLSLAAGVAKREVEDAMQGHVLAKGELMGLYNRQK